MYLLLLFPLFIATWFLLSRFVFARQVDHKPLLCFGVLFAIALIAAEVALQNPFSWLRFTPVSRRSVEVAGNWQHGISAAIVFAYLFMKRSRAPRDIAIAIGLWAVCNAAFVTSITISARIDYPFDLEWMEGTMVDQTLVAKHGPIYADPTPEFTPFLYGPVFFRSLSLLPYMDQSPFIWGRLLSLAMAGLIVLLVYFCATVLSEDGWIGLLVGVGFLASNQFTDAWFDLYRIDTMFVFLLMLGGVLLWQRPGSLIATFVAGLSLALAVFTKQSAALMVLFFVVWFFLAHGWKRALWLIGFGAGSGLVLMTVELILSGRYFIEYFYEMLFIRPLTWDLVEAKFLDRDLLALPGLAIWFLAVSGLVANYRRVGAKQWSKNIFLFIIVFFTITSFLMRSKAGGWDNCRIPMIIAGLLGTAIWFGEHRSKLSPSGIYPGLVLMVVYTTFMDPLGSQVFERVPTKQNLATQQRLVKYLRARPGKVWVPFHTHLCYAAKKQMCANTIALDDWFFLHESVPAPFANAMKSGEVSTVVLDRIPKWFKGPLRKQLNRHYDCRQNKFKWGKHQGLPVSGWKTRPSRFCELKKNSPRGRGE